MLHLVNEEMTCLGCFCSFIEEEVVHGVKSVYLMFSYLEERSGAKRSVVFVAKISVENALIMFFLRLI